MGPAFRAQLRSRSGLPVGGRAEARASEGSQVRGKRLAGLSSFISPRATTRSARMSALPGRSNDSTPQSAGPWRDPGSSDHQRSALIPGPANRAAPRGPRARPSQFAARASTSTQLDPASGRACSEATEQRSGRGARALPEKLLEARRPRGASRSSRVANGSAESYRKLPPSERGRRKLPEAPAERTGAAEGFPKLPPSGRVQPALWEAHSALRGGRAGWARRLYEPS